MLLRPIARSLATSTLSAELQAGGLTLVSKLCGVILTLASLGASILFSIAAIANRDIVDKEGTLGSSAPKLGQEKSKAMKKYTVFTFIMIRLA